VTGRRLLAALVAGEREPQGGASRALGALKHKRPQCERARTGQCPAPHGPLLAVWLELIEVLARPMAPLEQQSGALGAPWQAPLAPLASMPGVALTAARA